MKRIVFLAAAALATMTTAPARADGLPLLMMDEAVPQTASVARRTLAIQRQSRPAAMPAPAADLSAAEAKALWQKVVAPRPTPPAADAQTTQP